MINLVPPKIKKDQHLRKIGSKVLYFCFSIFLILAVFTTAIFIADGFLAAETKKLDTKIAETNASLNKFKDLETNISFVNKNIDKLTQAASERVLWSNLLSELANISPKTIQIKNLSLSESTKKASITGVASSRTEIAALKDNMESSPKFQNVTFSSSALETSTGSFTFNMSCELEETR